MWILCLSKVISTRDVSFDERKKYNLLYKEEPNKRIVELVEIPEVEKDKEEEDKEIVLPKSRNKETVST